MTGSPAAAAADAITPPSPSELGRMLRNRQFVFGLLVLVLLSVAAVFAPYLTPHAATDVDVINRLKPPSLRHWFGTDGFGRDVYTRVIFGARTSMIAGLFTMLFTVFVGGAIGITAGYFRGVFDNVVMRLMDAMMAIPAILLAIAFIAILGSGLTNVVIALSVAYVPRLARIVRSVVLTVREQLYVESARAIGAGTPRILIHYVLPQIVPTMLVQGSFIVAYAVIAEAALSFLGIGTPPPAPSWGNILSDGRSYLSLAPWVTVFPGLAIMAIVLSLNLLGDALRDIIDPRLRTDR
ncbi:MAG: ABC transporter permease [Alphaproteobacteria bacterium]|nr:ABC transporter permease [Alphaproteobacteria bacterium]